MELNAKVIMLSGTKGDKGEAGAPTALVEQWGNKLNTEITKLTEGNVNYGEIKDSCTIVFYDSTAIDEALKKITFSELASEVTAKIIGENAGGHNSVYRGQYLGNAVTDSQYYSIKEGLFTNMYIGDYWTINGINWRIAAFDYFIGYGASSKVTEHHIVLVPDTSLGNAAMNSTDTTSGGYKGSAMNSNGLNGAKTAINNAFGSENILTHWDMFSAAVTSGIVTGVEWVNTSVALMSEVMVFGSKINAAMSDGTNGIATNTSSKTMFPLFFYNNNFIISNETYWLRDICSSVGFVRVVNDGSTAPRNASKVHGIRPYFCLKGHN